MNDRGIYPSRSEAIRIALKDFLEDELGFYGALDDSTFRKFIKNHYDRKE